MPYLLVRHTVEDYANWKSGFDTHATARESAGSLGGHLLHSPNNPNELVLLLAWDDAERARQFCQSDDLREAMRGAGVIGHPELYLLEEIESVRT